MLKTKPQNLVPNKNENPIDVYTENLKHHEFKDPRTCVFFPNPQKLVSAN